MPTSDAHRAIFVPALRTYVLCSAGLHGAWELVQLPLYKVWATGTRGELMFDVLHCTIGDCLIAVSVLLISIVLMLARKWPEQRYLAVSMTALVLGVLYTGFSEWHNVYVKGAWAYSALMPTLPIQGYAIGVSPLLQWIVVPSMIFWGLRRFDSQSR